MTANTRQPSATAARKVYCCSFRISCSSSTMDCKSAAEGEAVALSDDASALSSSLADGSTSSVGSATSTDRAEVGGTGGGRSGSTVSTKGRPLQSSSRVDSVNGICTYGPFFFWAPRCPGLHSSWTLCSVSSGLREQMSWRLRVQSEQCAIDAGGQRDALCQRACTTQTLGQKEAPEDH